MEKNQPSTTPMDSLFSLTMSSSFCAICPKLVPIHSKKSHKRYYCFSHCIKYFLSFFTKFENSQLHGILGKEIRAKINSIIEGFSITRSFSHLFLETSIQFWERFNFSNWHSIFHCAHANGMPKIFILVTLQHLWLFIIPSSFGKIGNPPLDHISSSRLSTICGNHLDWTMEVFKKVLALVTFVIYDYPSCNFEIEQDYFLILDHIRSIDLRYLLLKKVVMLDQEPWNPSYNHF